MDNILSILIGLVSGISSGFFGIGGAIILIPALIYIFRFSQHLAQGTALAALLLPVGILAVIKYYKSGDVNIKVALFVAFGFVVGGFMSNKMIILRCAAGKGADPFDQSVMMVILISLQQTELLRN